MSWQTIADLKGYGFQNPRIIGDDLVVDIYNGNDLAQAGLIVGDVRGPQGSQGIQGVQGVQGVQGDKGLGLANARVVGDELVIDVMDGDTKTSEITAGNVRGPKGDKGDKGEKGDKGDTGAATAAFDDDVTGSETGWSSSKIAAELSSAVATRAPVSHTHAQADVTGLDTALAGKANTSHTHAAADVGSGTFAAARIPTATQAQAEAGTVSTGFMTPQRTKQAFDAYEAGSPTIAALRVASGDAPLLHDVFSRHSGKPGAAETGQAWGSLVPGGSDASWVVSGGMLDIADGLTMGYLEADLGEVVNRQGVEFSWDDRGGSLTQPGMMALIPWADGGIVANGNGRRTGVHLIVYSNGTVRAQYRSTISGSMVTVGSWDNVPAMSTDPSVKHTVEWARSGDELIITINSTTLMVKHANIRARADETFACWEPFPETGGRARFRMRRVWADGGSDAMGAREFSVRRQVAQSARVIRRIPSGDDLNPSAGNTYIEVPGSTLEVTPGDSGRVLAMARLFLRKSAASGLSRIRVEWRAGTSGTWATGDTVHLALDTPGAATYTPEFLIDGMPAGTPCQLRLTISDSMSGNSFFHRGDAGSAREMRFSAQPI